MNNAGSPDNFNVSNTHRFQPASNRFKHLECVFHCDTTNKRTTENCLTGRTVTRLQKRGASPRCRGNLAQQFQHKRVYPQHAVVVNFVFGVADAVVVVVGTGGDVEEGNILFVEGV